MSDGTKIEWADATWNPITGCSVVSPGCTNCYAMRLAGTRLRDHPSRAGLTRATKAGPVWTGEVRFNEQWLDQPLRWKRPRRIFVCAHADLFHENVPDEWIDKVFAVMALAPQHVFQVLTKRPERMREYCSRIDKRFWPMPAGVDRADVPDTPLPNVWLGVSVEDQARADERIPILLDTPAAVRWISAEPLLGPLDVYGGDPDPRLGGTVAGPGLSLGQFWESDGSGPFPGIDWVVAGGESGPGARPMHPDWARSLRDQCQAAGVAFHFKQWGGWMAIGQMADGAADALYDRETEFGRGRCKVEKLVMHADGEIFRGPAMAGPMVYQQGCGAMLMRLDKRAAGRLLDGRTWDEWPT